MTSQPAPSYSPIQTAPIAAPRYWQVQKGRFLSDLLRAWAADDGWNIVWRSGNDYMILGSSSVEARNFEEAADKLLRPIKDRLVPPIDYRFFRGDRQLVIRSPSDELGSPRY